jgi:putative lipoprotein
MNRKSTILAALALAASCVQACAANVTGAVTYRERIALPPGYVLRVALQDISRQDAPAEEIASVEMRPARQVPIRYALRYDQKRIDPSHTYSVSARILIDGRLAFISTRINPVITRGAPNKADILLQAVRRASQ